MKEELIADIEQDMLAFLDNAQMEQLHEALSYRLARVKIESAGPDVQKEEISNADLLCSFISSKRVEGCSEKSLRYYKSTICNMFTGLDKPVRHVTTDDLRVYLAQYRGQGRAGKVTTDNVRRVLSSFFSWLEDEYYIMKSPVKRIHKIKTGQTVKETYSDEDLELMRDSCQTVRDLAIVDLLASTGMRVGEMVKLDRSDIDFENRECVVFGKGDRNAPYILMRGQNCICKIISRQGPTTIRLCL